MKGNLTGQRVGAKAWFDFFTEYLTEEVNYQFSAECPRLGRNEKSTIWIHVDDLIFAADSKYTNEIFLPKIPGNFDTSVSKAERMGDEFNFLRRKYKLEFDGFLIQPGNYIQQMLKAYEEQFEPVKLQQLPADNSIQMEDKSEVLHEPEKISLFRSIVGPGIYLCPQKMR